MLYISRTWVGCLGPGTSAKFGMKRMAQLISEEAVMVPYFGKQLIHRDMANLNLARNMVRF
jgi:hypothetical protein